MPPGSVYNPIEPYLKINLAPLKDVKLTVIAERVRSKAYHDMEAFFLKKKSGLSKEDAKARARIAGQFHLERWKSQIPSR